MQSSKVRIRGANRKDAADLALLEDLASHGLASWLWFGAVKAGKAETVFQWGRDRMLNTDEPTSYPNGVIAENDTDICGMAVGYLMPIDLKDSAFETDIPVLAPIANLFGHTRGHWLIDSIATYPEFRKLGVGTLLLTDQINKARKAGLTRISLIAEDTNTAALSLYHKHGFELVTSRTAVRFSDTQTVEDYQLLTAEL